MATLTLLGPDDLPVRHIDLGARPLLLGRAHSNDIVVSELSVSGRHAAFWETEGHVYVEDLGSRNGTWLGEERVVGKSTLPVGSVVCLGKGLRLRIDSSSPVPPVLELEDIDLGLSYPLRRDRFRIGMGPDCDLVLTELDGSAATLVIDRFGGVSLGRDGEEKELAPGAEFKVGGRRFRLNRPTGTIGATLEVAQTTYGYSIEARRSGPSVLVRRAPDVEPVHFVEDNRAVLLFVLAQQVVSDREEGLPVAERGWMPDYDVATAIWGRTEGDRQLRNLNVLVWRVRRALEDAGFDPWFLEKVNRRLRVRLADVKVED